MEDSPILSSKQGVTFLRTVFNGLNTLAGLGILSVPYALASGGWLTLVLFVLIAVICFYTGILLKRCMDSNSFVRTYPDIGELAFGLKGKILVATFMYLELYLVSIEFLVLEGDNLDKLFPTKGWDLFGLMKIDGKQGFVLLAAFIVLPTTWMRNLGVLAYVSFGGVLSSLILVVCIIWSGVGDGVGFNENGMLLDWSGIPTALSLFVFCYSGHAVFPTIYTSMRDKSQFRKMMVICFSLGTVCFSTVAVTGYMMFGQNVNSQITLNLPTEKISSKIAIYTTIITPLTKYALLITPVANALEEMFGVSKNRTISLLLRTLLVISTTIAALVLPFFGYLSALTGSFLSTTASVLLPCTCYLKISKASKNKFGFEKLVIVVIIMFGTCIAIMGTYISSKQLITSL